MFLLFCVLLLPYCICETIENTNTEHVRYSRQLDFDGRECCPCPKVDNSKFEASDDSNASLDGLDSLPESSSPRMVEDGNPGSTNDCPCGIGDADSTSSASNRVPNEMQSAWPIVRTPDSKNDAKQLLHPEVSFASSDLETIKNATGEEHNEALARDTITNGAEAIVSTLDDGDSADALIEDAGSDTVTIIKPTDPLIGSDPKAEESNVQKVRCTTPALKKSSNDAIDVPSEVRESYVKPETPLIRTLLPTFPKLDSLLRRNSMLDPSSVDSLSKSTTQTNSVDKSNGLTGINNESRLSSLPKLKPIDITRYSLTPKNQMDQNNEVESTTVQNNVKMNNERGNPSQAHLLDLLRQDLQKQMSKLVDLSKKLNLSRHSKTDAVQKDEISDNGAKSETHLDAYEFVESQKSGNSVSKSDKIPVSLKKTTDTLSEPQVAETNNQCVAKTDEINTITERSQSLENNEPSNTDSIDKITSTSELDDNENIATVQRSDVIKPSDKLEIEEDRQAENHSLNSQENLAANIRDMSKNNQAGSNSATETGLANINSDEANDDEHSNENMNIPNERISTMNSGQENNDVDVAETKDASINSCSVTSENVQDRSLEEIKDEDLPAPTSVVNFKEDQATEVESPVKENQMSMDSNLPVNTIDKTNTQSKSTGIEAENEKISHKTLQNMSDSLLISSLSKKLQLNPIDSTEDVNIEKVKETVNDDDSQEIVTENINSIIPSNQDGLSNFSTKKNIDEPLKSESRPVITEVSPENLTFKKIDNCSPDRSFESDGFIEAHSMANATNATDSVASSTHDSTQNERMNSNINTQNSLPTIDDNVDPEDKSRLPECLNDTINKSVLTENNKPTSMTAEASDSLTNIITHPNALFQHLKTQNRFGSPLIIQPDTLINDIKSGLARGTPIPLSDLMQTNMQLPSIDVLKSRITDVFNLPSNSNSPLGKLGSIPDIIPRSSNILNSALESYPLVKPPILGSTNKINILDDILEKPLKGMDLDVIQLKPTILGQPTELNKNNVALNINSFVEPLKVKPVRIDPVLGNNGRLLNLQLDNLSRGTKFSKNTMIDPNKVNKMKSQDSLLGSTRNNIKSNKRVEVNPKTFRVPNLTPPNPFLSENKPITKSENPMASNNKSILKAPLQVGDHKTLKQIRDDFHRHFLESPLSMLNQISSQISQSIPKTTIPSLDSLSRPASAISVLKSPQLNHGLGKITTSNEKLATGHGKVLKKSQMKARRPIDKTVLENRNRPESLSNSMPTQDKKLLNKKMKNNKLNEPLKIRLPLRHRKPNMLMSASGPKEEIMNSTQLVQKLPIEINQTHRTTAQNGQKNRNKMSTGESTVQEESMPSISKSNTNNKQKSRDNSIESLTTILARVSSSLNKDNKNNAKKPKKILGTIKSDIESNSNIKKSNDAKLRNNEPKLGKIKNPTSNVKKSKRINNDLRVPLDENTDPITQDEVVMNNSSSKPAEASNPLEDSKKDTATEFKAKQVNIPKTPKQQLLIESPLLAKLKEAIESKRADILKPIKIKELNLKQPSSRANDMSNAASDSVLNTVSVGEPMKENVSYKCKFTCSKD